MEGERKIRNLVESNHEDICLTDVINLLITASGKARDLEYGSSKTDLRALKRILRKAKATLILFDERVRNEVTTSVNDIAAKKNINYKGNSEALKKAREVLINKNK